MFIISLFQTQEREKIETLARSICMNYLINAYILCYFCANTGYS